MKTTINGHGEKVTVIGTVADGRDGRAEVKVVEFVCCGLPCFALHGRAGGFPDARRFSTQVRRAKNAYAHDSNRAEWYV